MGDSGLSTLVKILSDTDLKIDDGFAILKSKSSIFTESQLDNIEKLFLGYGVIEGFVKQDGEIAFPISANNLSPNTIIHTSIDDFWRLCLNKKNIPNEYIVLGDKILSSIEASNEIENISIFLKWREILDAVSNYHIDGNYIIYIQNSEGGKEIIIKSYSNYNLVSKCNHDKQSDVSAGALLKVLDIEDAQSPERKSILKTAIYDLIQNEEEKNILTVISKGERIYNRYNDLLELYTKRFSVNKILSELEQKQLEYTTKINDFVSSSQNKAFAIPGALIAIGGLAKASGFLNSLLIFIGLFLVYRITLISNEALKDSYDSLKKSLKDVFERYSKFDEGVEVRTAASKIFSELNEKIETAKDRLNNVNNMGCFMLWVGGGYLLIKWLFF
ncbi:MULTISPECIES: hypothetical protein [unclassified Photorhabdus]|uniref:hypothetical protein n=1 Tax=unclassified Photorhabdus TaxID=2620880 RepID=UPI000DCD1025|nr:MULTISPECIES: hypothetical protein [unclassified Photorhabdus]RAW92482.1 hypothetical protein CKY05_23125 [Photorhabdus sp. S10-54]RAW92511.1 hypothetical protein CKY03_23030 [Photorhabdus sp. S9-53]RAW96120.1 hypothetical protein CKY04_23090 [Photorhabdus sp. S8-52]